MIKESDILFEIDPFYVKKNGTKGFVIINMCGTHGKPCAYIGYTGQKGLIKAIEECHRRYNLKLYGSY